MVIKENGVIFKICNNCDSPLFYNEGWFSNDSKNVHLCPSCKEKVTSIIISVNGHTETIFPCSNKNNESSECSSRYISTILADFIDKNSKQHNQKNCFYEKKDVSMVNKNIWQDVENGKNLPQTDDDVFVYIKYINEEGGYVDKMHLSECTNRCIFTGYTDFSDNLTDFSDNLNEKKVIAWASIEEPIFSENSNKNLFKVEVSDDDKKRLSFGKGNILICRGTDSENIPFIAFFKNSGSGKIGENSLDFLKTKDLSNPYVIMSFDNPESLQEVIRSLSIILDYFPLKEVAFK